MACFRSSRNANIRFHPLVRLRYICFDNTNNIPRTSFILKNEPIYFKVAGRRERERESTLTDNTGSFTVCLACGFPVPCPLWIEFKQLENKVAGAKGWMDGPMERPAVANDLGKHWTEVRPAGLSL